MARIINKGLINLIPFILIGAICLATLEIPIPAYQHFISTVLGGSFLMVLNDATFEVIALAALLSVSHASAREHRSTRNSSVHVVIPMFVSFAAFTILFASWDRVDKIFYFTDLGASGMFRAFLVGLVATELFFYFARFGDWLLPDRIGFDAYLQIRSAFRSIIPIILTLLVCTGLRFGLDQLVVLTGIDSEFGKLIKANLVNDSLPAVIQTVLYSQVLGFFGVHYLSSFSFFPFVRDIAASGSTPVMFASQDFYLQFVAIGGAGATLGLIVALFAVGSRGKNRSFARAAIFPAVFNLNEPLLYGFPIVLNPFMFIPFLLAPMVAAILGFICFSTGIVPPIINDVSWTCPPLISGYLSTGSLAGTALQCVSIAASIGLYIPFVTAQKGFERKQYEQNFNLLQKTAESAIKSEYLTIIDRDDAVGEIARDFSIKLREYALDGQLPFTMAYQPKVDKHNKLVGCEALLRWHGTETKNISPLLLVELMDESGLSSVLGRWVTETCIREFAELKAGGIEDLRMSLNLNPRHLAVDDGFLKFLKELRDHYRLQPGEVELEITEHAMVRHNMEMRRLFRSMRDLGYSLAIDDMGVGYSSLSYISDFEVRTVKIDASMIDRVEDDYQQQEIVRSITNLAKPLALTVVAEGVEKEGQVESLIQLGVEVFQGYYFSRPLTKQDFIEFAKSH